MLYRFRYYYSNAKCIKKIDTNGVLLRLGLFLLRMELVAVVDDAPRPLLPELAEGGPDPHADPHVPRLDVDDLRREHDPLVQFDERDDVGPLVQELRRGVVHHAERVHLPLPGQLDLLHLADRPPMALRAHGM